MNQTWRKPNRVVVEGEYLIANFAAARRYPLRDAVDGGRALKQFGEAADDDRAQAFTEAWGFLHNRYEDGRADRYPLRLFHAKRQHLLALTQLMNALRTGRHLEDAVAALKEARATVHHATWGGPPRDDRLPLRPELRALVEAGIAPLVAAAFVERTRVTLPEAAAQDLASELNIQHQFSIVRNGRGRWITEDTPVVDCLDMALRWTLRAGFGRWHYRICESCGTPWIAGRSDSRFCTERCGTRLRVRRFRQAERSE